MGCSLKRLRAGDRPDLLGITYLPCSLQLSQIGIVQENSGALATVCTQENGGDPCASLTEVSGWLPDQLPSPLLPLAGNGQLGVGMFRFWPALSDWVLAPVGVSPSLNLFSSSL